MSGWPCILKGCHKPSDLRNASFFVAIYCIGVALWDLTILHEPFNPDQYDVFEEDDLHDAVTVLAYICFSGGVIVVLAALGFISLQWYLEHKARKFMLMDQYVNFLIILMSVTNVVRILNYATSIWRLKLLDDDFDHLDIFVYSMYLGISIIVTIFSIYYCVILKNYSVYLERKFVERLQKPKMMKSQLDVALLEEDALDWNLVKWTDSNSNCPALTISELSKPSVELDITAL